MATLYVILLTLHNINRWLVLLAGMWTLFRGFSGLSSGRAYTAADRRPVVAFVGTVSLQLVLGLLLFGFMGAQNMPVFAGARSSFQWEHLGLGVLAAVFATLASALSKRATGNPARFRAMTIWTVLSLVVALAGIPWWRPLLRFFNL
ncbi:hypothetical protein [Deinococcus humi]|uniref:Cytochrome B n=1 Tax=Deinococcus humi TaxID=662880 RepID=A0A7W8JUG8_9DEIO|nr:hypothetical protein [Deinococcus humi]MBB5362178.1 hypothetical protein [Deinococcus humi]GGO21708.1 hypothetical protein GCM10008949_08200 [Deinococcus humi]